MKKRSLLLIALIAVLCLSIVGVVACKPNEPVDPDKQSIEISNAMALAAKWNVGEADRTVEVKLSDGLKDKAVTLTAEPQGIVTIDGMKLTAAKNGTTVVTARVSLDEEHEYTDSVEIKVTYNYSLTISNKANLTKAFRLGDADREVTVALSDAIKNNKVDIKSSNTNAVKVVEGKLHAEAKGESTITATTSLNGVEFKDSFKVKVWGAFQFELTNPEDFTEPIGKNVTKEIKYAMEEEGDYTVADVNITSDHPEIVAIEGSSIKTLAVGTAKITVACGGITREFNVTVEVQPVLTISELDKTIERYVGKSFELPEILVATDSSENDVKASVTVTCDNSALTISDDKTTASADQIGRYTVIYKFTDPSKGEKIVRLPVDVVEEIFDEVVTYKAGTQTDGKLATKLAGEEASLVPTVTANTNDIFVGSFNGVTPSQFYYAEATFAIPEVGVSNDVRVALGHYLADETYVLTSTMVTYSGDFFNIDVDLSKTDNLTKGQAVANNQTCMFVYKVLNSKHIAKLAGDVTDETYSTSLIKISVARDGDYFYTFINDQYVQCVTLQALRGKDTVPALVGKYFVNGNTSVTNIAYSADEATVRAKLYTTDGLLGEHKEKMFVPYIDANDTSEYSQTGSGSHQASYDNNVEIDPTLSSETNGTAFTYKNGVQGEGTNNQNGSTVSPYIYFDGNFTFSWETEITSTVTMKSEQVNSASTDTYRSILELKDNTINYDIVQLGVGRGGTADNKYNHAHFNVKGYSKTKTEGYRQWGEPSKNDFGTSGLNNIGNDTRVRFTLTRILKADHAEYIMTATALEKGADGIYKATAKTYTRIVNIGGAENKVQSGNYTTTHSNWKEPVIAYWRNSGVSANFTNISWSLLPEDISAEFVNESAGAMKLTNVNEKRGTDRNGTEIQDINVDILKVNSPIYSQDIVVDMGENYSLTKGKYIVTILANGDRQIGIGNTKGEFSYSDIELSAVYTTTITLDEDSTDRYLKLKGVTLGHGTYIITIDPAPQEPTE